MFQGQNAKRTITAIAVFTAQQATGATAFAYFGPQYFRLLVGNKDETDLLLTAIFGAVKVAACLAFVIFVADNVNRRSILTGGALFMAACQLATAVVVKTHPVDPDASATSAGVATVGLIYLFVIAYNFSWGCLPWPYVSEVSPNTVSRLVKLADHAIRSFQRAHEKQESRSGLQRNGPVISSSPSRLHT